MAVQRIWAATEEDDAAAIVCRRLNDVKELLYFCWVRDLHPASAVSNAEVAELSQPMMTLVTHDVLKR